MPQFLYGNENAPRLGKPFARMLKKFHCRLIDGFGLSLFTILFVMLIVVDNVRPYLNRISCFYSFPTDKMPFLLRHFCATKSIGLSVCADLGGSYLDRRHFCVFSDNMHILLMEFRDIPIKLETLSILC